MVLPRPPRSSTLLPAAPSSPRAPPSGSRRRPGLSCGLALPRPQGPGPGGPEMEGDRGSRPTPRPAHPRPSAGDQPRKPCPWPLGPAPWTLGQLRGTPLAGPGYLELLWPRPRGGHRLEKLPPISLPATSAHSGCFSLYMDEIFTAVDSSGQGAERPLWQVRDEVRSSGERR